MGKIELSCLSAALSLLLLLDYSVRFQAGRTKTFVSGNEACKDLVVGMMEGQMKNIVPCIKDLGLNTGKNRSDNYNCIMKCMLVRAGTLTPDGGVTVLQSIISILEMFPNQYIEKAFMEISKCQEFAGTTLTDPSDTHCNLYGPLLKCGVEFMLNVCRD